MEEGTDAKWSCQLHVTQAQSRMELSIEVSPSKLNSDSSGQRVPSFFYDIYQSRSQPARRSETVKTFRVDLMVISRTSLPVATFHSLGRINVSQDGIAGWLTTTISEHLQKVLKAGFDFSAESSKAPSSSRLKIPQQPSELPLDGNEAMEDDWAKDEFDPQTAN